MTGFRCSATEDREDNTPAPESMPRAEEAPSATKKSFFSDEGGLKKNVNWNEV